MPTSSNRWRSGAPASQEFGGIDRSARLDGCVSAAVGQQPLSVVGERIRIGQRHQRALIEEPQVADLIANRPSG